MKETIDKLLFDIESNKNSRILDEDDFADYSEFIEYRKLINLILDEYKLIKKPFTNSLDIVLTKLGTEVINQGGWIKYLENEKLKEQIENEKLNAELENLKTSTEVNKFLLKTKWLPHVVAILSFLFSIYVFFDAKDDSKKLEQRIGILEKIIQKTEKK